METLKEQKKNEIQRQVNVTKLRSDELAQAVQLTNQSFEQMFKKLNCYNSSMKKEGDRISQRFFRNDCESLALRDSNNQLRGVCFLQFCGSRVSIGPIAVDPTFTGLASFEVIKNYALNQHKLNIMAETVTFPHSALHFASHWKAFDPMLPSVFFVKKISGQKKEAVNIGIEICKFSTLTQENKRKALIQLDEVSQSYETNLKYSSEISHVDQMNLGETFILLDSRTKKMIAFAVCHMGLRSESFEDGQLLIKHLLIRREFQNKEIFQGFLLQIENFAIDRLYNFVATMCESGQRKCVEALMGLKYNIGQVHTHWRRLHREGAGLSKNAHELSERKETISSLINDDYFLNELR